MQLTILLFKSCVQRSSCLFDRLGCGNVSFEGLALVLSGLLEDRFSFLSVELGFLELSVRGALFVLGSGKVLGCLAAVSAAVLLRNFLLDLLFELVEELLQGELR